MIGKVDGEKKSGFVLLCDVQVFGLMMMMMKVARDGLGQARALVTQFTLHFALARSKKAR